MMRFLRPFIFAVVLASAFFYFTTYRNGRLHSASGISGSQHIEITEAAGGEALTKTFVREEPGPAVGVVHHRQLEPVRVRRLRLVQVADPGEILDHRWRHPAAHGAGHDRVAEFQAEDLSRVDPGIDAGEDVHLLVRDERDLGNPVLGAGPGEAFQRGG